MGCVGAGSALIAAIAAHYGQSEVDVLDTTGREGDYFGMARVINAEEMIKAYAQLHPERTFVWTVTDTDLPENNGCYRVAEGTCERLEVPCTEAEQLTIAELTHRVLTEENPLMSLMMND